MRFLNAGNFLGREATLSRDIFKMSGVESQLETFISLASPRIDAKAKDLQTLSLKIWEKPELGYEEHFAHGILSDFFEEQGFEVTRHYTLPTAFRAVFGGDPAGPTVAVLCEYDALPGIGHGCGHNLIAVAGTKLFFLQNSHLPIPRDPGPVTGLPSFFVRS